MEKNDDILVKLVTGKEGGGGGGGKKKVFFFYPNFLYVFFTGVLGFAFLVFFSNY
jgi:hypothetical protein